jgi:hypothetical protein
MTGVWKIITPIAILIVAVILIALTQVVKNKTEISGPVSGKETPEKFPGKVEKETQKETTAQTGGESLETGEKKPEEELPPATGKIDDTVSAIWDGFLGEVSEAENGIGEESNFVEMDSQAVNDFTQAYDENEF